MADGARGARRPGVAFRNGSTARTAGTAEVAMPLELGKQHKWAKRQSSTRKLVLSCGMTRRSSGGSGADGLEEREGGSDVSDRGSGCRIGGNAEVMQKEYDRYGVWWDS